MKLRLNHNNPTPTLIHAVCGAKLCILDKKEAPSGVACNFFRHTDLLTMEIRFITERTLKPKFHQTFYLTPGLCPLYHPILSPTGVFLLFIPQHRIWTWCESLWDQAEGPRCVQQDRGRGWEPLPLAVGGCSHEISTLCPRMTWSNLALPNYRGVCVHWTCIYF